MARSLISTGRAQSWNLGLHIAHLLDKVLANLGDLAAHLLAELVNILFGGRAGIFGHVVFLRVSGRVANLTEMRHRLVYSLTSKVIE